MTMAKRLDRDLTDHARSQLAEAAERRVRAGLGPASAARAAIRETKALFPHDWRLGVQGDDGDEFVEVWEVEHKYPQPVARVSREPVPGPRTKKARTAKSTKRRASIRRAPRSSRRSRSRATRPTKAESRNSSADATVVGPVQAGSS